MRDLLIQSLERLLADQCTPEFLRHCEEQHGPELPDVWQTLEDSGFALAAVSEAGGGAGLPWSDIYPLLQLMGAHALPLPLAENLLAAALLDQAGIDLPEGALTLGDGACAGLRLEGGPGTWRLSGSVAHVPWARQCTHVVVDALDAQGRPWIALVARASAQLQPDLNVAREPRDRLLLDGAVPVAAAPWPQPEMAAPVRVHGAMARSAQMAGAMERIVQTSVQYAGERVQFGKPIGKFQAIQQQLATAGCESAAAGAGAAFAFARAGLPGHLLAVAAAKLRASEAAGHVASVGHGTHGAIGFTYEHHLHFLTRRLWSWRSEFGNSQWWSLAIGRSVLASPLSFWEQITDRQQEHLRIDPSLSLEHP